MTCTCQGYCSCGCESEQPINVIEQAVNDALAGRIDELNGYTDSAKDSADAAKVSEINAEGYAEESKGFRDQTEIIYQNAQALVPEILEASQNVEDAAITVQNAIEIASSIAIVRYPYTVVGGEDTIVVPNTYNTRTVQSIDIEGFRQYPGYGYTYDAATHTVTMDQPFDMDQTGTVVMLFLGTLNADSPETVYSNFASTSGASMIGTAAGKTVQDELDSFVAENTRQDNAIAEIDSAIAALKIEISISKHVANVKDPQFAGGAKGDWNETAQTGTDDTNAFQAAIDYLASLPTERNAGARVLYVPAGTYMTKGITVPQSYLFGFNMMGAGRDATMIYCNPVSPSTTPGFLSEVEFVFIDNLTMTGSAKSTIIDTANYVTDLVKTALPDGRADCDLVCGEGVRLLNGANLITHHGRGLVFKGMAGIATNFLNIHCSTTQTWSPGSAINDFNTGMRNYHIDGCRFDQMTSLVTVSGTGSAIDYIHGIRITNNDILGIGTVVQAPTATLRGMMINGNTMFDSGNGNVVYCYSMVGGIVSNNIISKKVNLETVPTIPNDALPRIVRADRAIIGLTISGNEFGAIRDAVVSATVSSGQVRIVNNTFHQAFILASGTLFTGADCSGLFITGNTFTGSNSGIQPWSNSTQVSVGYFKNNLANSKFVHPGNLYTPTVNKGGTAVTPTLSVCYWEYDGYYCTARYAVAAPMGGAGGVINISTPMTPLAEFTGLTSTIAGGGTVNYLSGGAPATVVRVLTTGFVNIMSTSLTPLSGTDFPATMGIEFEIKFKA